MYTLTRYGMPPAVTIAKSGCSLPAPPLSLRGPPVPRLSFITNGSADHAAVALNAKRPTTKLSKRSMLKLLCARAQIAQTINKNAADLIHGCVGELSVRPVRAHSSRVALSEGEQKVVAVGGELVARH